MYFAYIHSILMIAQIKKMFFIKDGFQWFQNPIWVWSLTINYTQQVTFSSNINLPKGATRAKFDRLLEGLATQLNILFDSLSESVL